MGAGRAICRAAMSPDCLVEAVRDLFTRPGFEPPFVPRVALEVHAFSRGTQDDPVEVADLLERDPVLAAGVMRAVELRAPAGWRASSLHDVLARCGVRGLANLALEVGTLGVFAGARGYDAPMQACREHAIRAAHTATILAGEASVESEPAFMAGLLHDVGTAVGLIALADWRLFPVRHCYEEVQDALLEAHERIGGVVADAWHLPLEVREAIAHHHGAPRGKLAAVVEATERVCLGTFRSAEVTASLPR